MHRLVIVLLVVGCGHKDECERLIERAGQLGAEMSQRTTGDPAKVLADCRAHIDEVRSNPVEMCVISARSIDEAKSCVVGPLHSQGDRVMGARKAVIEDAGGKSAP